MRRRRNPNQKILRPVFPNAGLEAEYRRKLYALIEELHNSFTYWIKASYRRNEPVLAQDESEVVRNTRPSSGASTRQAGALALDATPASQLRIAINKLIRQWEKNFDQASKDLAKYFAIAIEKRSDAALRDILRRGGWSVRFQITPAMRDVMKAAIAENVSLIRSLPERYLTNVAGVVYRSVQEGRDLSILSEELEKQYGVTKRRAAFIARDQNAKMTSMFNRVRQQELGITEALWMHSHAGKTPRPTHLANHGREYDVKSGWWDPHEKKFIWPGILPNCRCTSKSVVKGFS